MSEQPKPVTAAVYDSLFDEFGTDYYLKTLLFFRSFVANTDPSSKMAYHTAFKLEVNSLGLEELSENFPAKRRRHKERKNAYQVSIQPLEKQRKKINDEIAVLRKEIARFKAGDPSARHLGERVNDLQGQLYDVGVQIGAVRKPPTYKAHFQHKKFDRAVPPPVYKPDWSYISEWIDTEIAKHKKYKTSPIVQNIATVCEHFKISEGERKLLEILALYDLHPKFKLLVDELSLKMPVGYEFVLAAMLGTSAYDYRQMIDEDAVIVSTGLLLLADSKEQNKDKQKHIPSINPLLMKILTMPQMDIDSFIGAVIGKPLDMSEIEDDWDQACDNINATDRLIAEGVLSSQGKGRNGLFFGLQDTGKTYAAIKLAKRLGCEAYLIGEKSHSGSQLGRDITAEERTGIIMLAQTLLSRMPNALLIVDECEAVMPREMTIIDALSGGAKDRSGSRKLTINRLLEDNQTRTLWISNETDFVAAVRRRFKFSIEFNIPPALKRQSIWSRKAKELSIDLSPEDTKGLADKYRGPAGVATVALEDLKDVLARNKALAVPRDVDYKEVIERALSQYSRLVFGSRDALINENASSGKFRINLINAVVEDVPFDLVGLTKALTASNHRDFAILAYGPPGGGKDAYASHLADTMGIEVMYRRASQLLGSCNGETEGNIRDMFQEASEAQAFLHLAEADSFFRDRRYVSHSWEVPIINEMLSNLERHRYPCFFSTNLEDKLDPATKRRMTFKLKFDYMLPEQARSAFDLYFDEKPPASLDHITYLSAGDFANVARQLRFLPGRDPQEITRMLEAEVRAKEDARNSFKAGGVGFAHSVRVRSLIPGSSGG